jgi:hypothetical protein
MSPHPSGHPGAGALPDLAPVDQLDTSWSALMQRRLTGGFRVDPWGLDADLLAMAGRLDPQLGLVRADGAELVPDGPALLVWQGPVWANVMVAVAIGRATNRPVRCTGVPDVAPVLGVARRFGGVVGDQADVRGLLRAGHLVAVRTRAPAPGPDWLPTAIAEAAVDVGAPLVPVTVRLPRPWSPVGRVTLGSPVPTRTRTAARPLADIADRTAAGFSR